jgi:hypothetical protein
MFNPNRKERPMQLLQCLPTGKICIMTVTFLIAMNAIYWGIMVPISNSLKAQQVNHAKQYGTLQLQLFFREEGGAKAILEQWNDEARQLARQSLLFDFALMPTYVFSFIGLMLLAAKLLTGGWQTAAHGSLLLPLLAWIADATENIMDLRLLGTPRGQEPDAILLWIAATATTLKFLSLALFSLVWFVLLGVGLYWWMTKVGPDAA